MSINDAIETDQCKERERWNSPGFIFIKLIIINYNLIKNSRPLVSRNVHQYTYLDII